MSATVAVVAIVGRVGEPRPVHCPECGRYLGGFVAAPGLPAGAVWSRYYCRTCQRWAWFDAATGERKHDGLTKRPLP
jgi:transposase-like protein